MRLDILAPNDPQLGRQFRTFRNNAIPPEFTSADAAWYAQVRAKLERAGTPIGSLDTLIAAQAVARRVVLVSNSEREFSRVAGLHIQNWAS